MVIEKAGGDNENRGGKVATGIPIPTLGCKNPGCWDSIGSRAKFDNVGGLTIRPVRSTYTRLVLFQR